MEYFVYVHSGLFSAQDFVKIFQLCPEVSFLSLIAIALLFVCSYYDRFILAKCLSPLMNNLTRPKKKIFLLCLCKTLFFKSELGLYWYKKRKK